MYNRHPCYILDLSGKNNALFVHAGNLRKRLDPTPTPHQLSAALIQFFNENTASLHLRPCLVAQTQQSHQRTAGGKKIVNNQDMVIGI